VPSRGAMAEEADPEERAGRQWLRAADARLHDLKDRRSRLLAQVRLLSDEQRRLYEERQPNRAQLEAALHDHRALGQEIGRLRSRRDELRNRLLPSREALREARPRRDRGVRLTAEQVRREIAILEMRQQTHALPLDEENALISRIRALRQDLDGLEKTAAAEAQATQARADLMVSYDALRNELAEVSKKMDSIRAEREARMAAMRVLLEEDGRRLGEMREKASARSVVMARLEETNQQVLELERQIRHKFDELRGRRVEARQTIRDYNRTVRDAVSSPTGLDQSAEAHLEALLKRGKVSLGG
jgi:uncharacterized coiled-coil DUF342 family protein